MHIGVKGFVKDVDGRVPRGNDGRGAAIRIRGMTNITMYADKDNGDYYRLLVPGVYALCQSRFYIRFAPLMLLLS